MRKIVIVAGLLAGAAFLFTTGTPAKAWVGCECVKLGAPAVCVKGVLECSAIGRRLPCPLRLRGAEENEAPSSPQESQSEGEGR